MKVENRLIDSSLLKKIQGLKIDTNILLNKGYQGGRKSSAKGSSIEFSDYKEYVLGDDFRKIDWNAYGRFEKLFIKVFEEERQVNVNVFLDTSLSMDFGNPKKSVIAKKLCAVFSYLSLSHLDRICVYSNSEKTLDNSGYFNGKNTFQSFVNYIENLNFNNKNDLFKLIKTRFYKSGISIIISDLYSENFEETIKYLAYMNQHIIVLNLLSIEELKPKESGDIRFIDSETDEGKDLCITSNVLKAYEKTLKDFIGKHKELCKKFGCKYVLLSNEISIEAMIFDKLVKHRILR